GLPSWLGIDAGTGRIRGTTPSSADPQHGMTVTVTDAAGATATTAPFSWAVGDGPVIQDLGEQISHVGDTVSVPVIVDCGTDGPCTVTMSGEPSWLTLTDHTIRGTSPGTTGT